MSAGSLKTVLERDTKLGGGSNAATPKDEEHDASRVTELSWSNKWWPFSIVGPAAPAAPNEQDTNQGTPDDDGAGLGGRSSEETAHEASRSFLSMFAGKRTTEQVAAEHEATRLRDEAEERMLDAELSELVSMSKATPTAIIKNGKSDGVDQASIASNSGSPKRPTSFLPTNIFSSTSAAASSALGGPAAILSSLSLNPFASASPPKQKPGPARSFSTSSTSPKSNDPHSPSNASIPPSESTETQEGEESDSKRRRKVNPLLDEQDQANSKQEAEQDLSMFYLMKERYDKPKLPLVYAHGLFGADVFGPQGIKSLQIDYWVGVKGALEAMGVEVLIGRVPASASKTNLDWD